MCNAFIHEILLGLKVRAKGFVKNMRVLENNSIKEIFLLFHNNLFKETELLNGKNVFLLQPDDSENHIKNAYIYATISFYKDYVKNINIITREELLEENNKFSVIHCYNPTDHETKTFLYSLNNTKIIEHNNPLFIINEDQFQNMKFNNNQSFLKHFKNIHKWKYVDTNYDKLNRNAMKIKNYTENNTKFLNDLEYYKKGINYVETKHGKNNVNIDIETLSLYPVSFVSAEKNLESFINQKLNSFGEYQDAIKKDHAFLFHSNISSSLNVGLITPNYVYQQIIKKAKQNKNININNIEGFLRQILGWREYIRYIYINHGKEIMEQNYWNNNKKLNWEYWNGSKNTGIEFLDNEIQKCKKYAYAHHIIRLMVFLNAFVLLGVSPNEIYKWFMNICAIDAYPWCMIPNIWIMGYFTPDFMSKPYLCTSNYISNMSNKEYGRNKIFDALFYKFLSQNKNKVTIYLRNLKHFENMKQDDQLYMLKLANNIQKKLVY